MKINTNVSSLNTQRILGQTGADASRYMERLSSGFRINSAKDDAAGLAIANKLRADNRSLQQAQRNASQANSMLQIADSAAQTISSILDRMKELATQAASDNVGNERDKIGTEFTALNNEITRIVNTTNYQGKYVLQGGAVDLDTAAGKSDALTSGEITGIRINGARASTSFTFDASVAGQVKLDAGGGVSQTLAVLDGKQTLEFTDLGISVDLGSSFVADGSSAIDGTKIDTTAAGGQTMHVLVDSTGAYGTNDQLDVSLSALSALGSADVSSLTAARTALANIDTKIGTVNSFLANVGALQNRVDFASQNVAAKVQNVAAAESTIRDADMAQEMSNFSKTQILQQAGVAMLAQANQAPQLVLKLLG